jgi:hypothetical protein
MILKDKACILDKQIRREKDSSLGSNQQEVTMDMEMQ